MSIRVDRLFPADIHISYFIFHIVRPKRVPVLTHARTTSKSNVLIGGVLILLDGQILYTLTNHKQMMAERQYLPDYDYCWSLTSKISFISFTHVCDREWTVDRYIFQPRQTCEEITKYHSAMLNR